MGNWAGSRPGFASSGLRLVRTVNPLMSLSCPLYRRALSPPPKSWKQGLKSLYATFSATATAWRRRKRPSTGETMTKENTCSTSHGPGDLVLSEVSQTPKDKNCRFHFREVLQMVRCVRQKAGSRVQRLGEGSYCQWARSS